MVPARPGSWNGTTNRIQSAAAATSQPSENEHAAVAGYSQTAGSRLQPRRRGPSERQPADESTGPAVADGGAPELVPGAAAYVSLARKWTHDNIGADLGAEAVILSVGDMHRMSCALGVLPKGYSLQEHFQVLVAYHHAGGTINIRPGYVHFITNRQQCDNVAWDW